MIATIGYERAELSDFVATLRLANIEVLIDIRDRAQSRRPGFSKSALASAVMAAGIEYIHIPELGDPKDGREAARSGNFELFRDIFAKVMESERAELAMQKVEAIALTKAICLMCFERDQHTCHRKIVADHLESRLGCKANHLGVKHGAGREIEARRMRYINQGSTAQIEQVL